MESLWRLTYDLFTFLRPLSYVEMLIIGLRFTDAGIDVIGCVGEQEFS